MSDANELLAPPDAQRQAVEIAGRHGPVQRFEIQGLYGYRTISLSSTYAATILIAKNGTGKTTLLGALDAFLRLQLNRLSALDFSRIACRLHGIQNELILTHEDVVAFLQPPTDGDFQKLVSRTGLDQSKLFHFILGDFRNAIATYYIDYDTSSVVNLVGRSFAGDLDAATKACETVYRSLFQRTPGLKTLYTQITASLLGHEIVYLPTYRRVELALTESGEGRRRRGLNRPKFNISASGLHTGEIQFGLGDISERLSELNAQIIASSNRGYREISENIINELIRGFEVSPDTPRPTSDDLKLFFSRLESDVSPYSRISAPDYVRIYSGEGVPEESRKFLTYFLGKLNDVVNITKEIEKPVGDFISTCNKYLSSVEPSTAVSSETDHYRLEDLDSKILKVDRKSLSVHVESVSAHSPISLDALSSGEKQMISLFAKMYLYPKKKIVLIDEPELSLSIDWQRGILIDVLLSPQCAQVIAITHSPFVFDNSLEPFARTLHSTAYTKEATQEAASDSETIEGTRG